LFGTLEALKLVKEGNFLAVFDRERFLNKKLFALVVEKTGQKAKMEDW